MFSRSPDWSEQRLRNAARPASATATSPQQGSLEAPAWLGCRGDARALVRMRTSAYEERCRPGCRLLNDARRRSTGEGLTRASRALSVARDAAVKQPNVHGRNLRL